MSLQTHFNSWLEKPTLAISVNKGWTSRPSRFVGWTPTSWGFIAVHAVPAASIANWDKHGPLPRLAHPSPSPAGLQSQYGSEVSTPWLPIKRVVTHKQEQSTAAWADCDKTICSQQNRRVCKHSASSIGIRSRTRNPKLWSWPNTFQREHISNPKFYVSRELYMSTMFPEQATCAPNPMISMPSCRLDRFHRLRLGKLANKKTCHCFTWYKCEPKKL